MGNYNINDISANKSLYQKFIADKRLPTRLRDPINFDLCSLLYIYVALNSLIRSYINEKKHNWKEIHYKLSKLENIQNFNLPTKNGLNKQATHL